MMKTKISSHRILYHKIPKFLNIKKDRKYYRSYLERNSNVGKLSSYIEDMHSDLMTLSVDIDDSIDECIFPIHPLTGILTDNRNRLKLSGLKRYSFFSTGNIHVTNSSKEYLYSYSGHTMRRLSIYSHSLKNMLQKIDML